MEDLPRPRYGRKPLDPTGEKAVKTSGVWLAPHDHTTYTKAVNAVASKRGVSAAKARRAILLSGVRAEMAAIRAAEDQEREAAK